jgi:hypothetical protein
VYASVGLGVKSLVVALAAGLYLVSLGLASANTSLDVSLNDDPPVHIQNQRIGCRLNVKLICSLGLQHYRDCHKVRALICE